MTVEEAKEYLERGFAYREKIQGEQRRVDHWRHVAESMAIKSGSGGGSSYPSKKVETCAVNIVDIESEIQEELDRLQQIELEIESAINKYVEDPKLKLLLEMRYLNYMRWREISSTLHMTLRWVMTLHKDAVEAFAEKAPAAH